jgi:hypothetical protein
LKPSDRPLVGWPRYIAGVLLVPVIPALFRQGIIGIAFGIALLPVMYWLAIYAGGKKDETNR